LVDYVKVFFILNMPPPTTTKHLWSTLVHIGYYHRFIWNCESITTPLEKLLKKAEFFHWTHECDRAFNILKEKLSSDPILTYPNWNIEFHVHIDATSTTLGDFLMQLSEGNLDHPIYFSSRNLSQVEHTIPLH